MWKPLIGSCRYKTRSVFWIATVSCKNRTELLETHCCLQTPLAIHYLSNLSCRYHLQLILIGEDVMTWSCSGVTWRLLVEAVILGSHTSPTRQIIVSPTRHVVKSSQPNQLSPNCHVASLLTKCFWNIVTTGVPITCLDFSSGNRV